MHRVHRRQRNCWINTSRRLGVGGRRVRAVPSHVLPAPILGVRRCNRLAIRERDELHPGVPDRSRGIPNIDVCRRLGARRLTRAVASTVVLSVALVLAGCGAESGSDQVATKLGQKSSRLRTLLVDADTPPAAQQFSGAQRPVAAAVLRGDLAAVTEDQVRSLLDTQQSATRATAKGVSALERRLRAVEATRCPTSGADGDVLRFVKAYNGLVRSVAEDARAEVAALREAHRANKQQEDMFRAVVRFRQTGSPRGVFAAIETTRRNLSRIRTIDEARNRRPTLRDLTDREGRSLVELANASSEVSALVRRIRENSPRSLLNDIIVPREG